MLQVSLKFMNSTKLDIFEIFNKKEFNYVLVEILS